MTVSSETSPKQSSQPARLKLNDLLKLVRVRQWSKNLICFAPLLFAVRIHEFDLLIRVIGCFLAFCLASSAIYILNDIVDCDKDKAHPTKRNRPIAAGKISSKSAAVVGVALALTALATAAIIRPTLALVIALYLALMLAYSLKLKHYVLIDIFCIATGFVLRAMGGAVSASLTPSGWFLLCTSFGALFLALEKRRQELNLLRAEAEDHRPTLTAYHSDIVDRLEATIVAPLLTCYALYSFQSPHGQWMLTTVPFVVFGIMRYQVLSTRYSTTGTPEEVLLTDKPIQIAVLLWALTSAAVVYNIMPSLVKLLVNTADAIHF